MKKSIFALASGAFTFGASEFVIMGVLPKTAQDTHASIPTAGQYVSAYAIGVCFGALILIFGRKIRPRNLIIAFLALGVVGNFLACIAPNYPILLIARFISGLPHGAFFGTATIMAHKLADRGQEGRAVSQTILGQTVANMVGVPFGTWLGSTFSWRYAFLFLSIWAVITIVFVLRFVPSVDPVADNGMAGQFKFLTKPAPWLVIMAVFVGNTGIFCWWSYVSPWLQKTGGWSESYTPLLMALAGFGMVLGSLACGPVSDRWGGGLAAGVGQIIAMLALIAIFLTPGSRLSTAMLAFICAFGMFFLSPPEQLVMVQVSQGGGEMLAGTLVQIAFNGGNSLGSTIGGIALNNTNMNYHYSALSGVPLTLIGAILLFTYYFAYEKKRMAAQRSE